MNRLTAHKLPSRLLILDTLPRNAMGKVVKPSVTALFTEQAQSKKRRVSDGCNFVTREDGILNDKAETTQTHAPRSKLTRQQITGFWGAWAGWTLDGMDSVIYALVLSPALTELLPKSGISANTGQHRLRRLHPLCPVSRRLGTLLHLGADRGSVRPQPRFGRDHLHLRHLHRGCRTFAIGLSACTLSTARRHRHRRRMGVAGTYVAEAWPEDRRKMGAGYLQTGYYAGFFLASALNYTVAAHYGWRAMFWCGLTPVVVAFVVFLRVKEPERWKRKTHSANKSPLRQIFQQPYLRRTIVNSALLTAAICGLWAAAVYAPTALVQVAQREGSTKAAAVQTSSIGMGLLSLGTILGCLAVPPLAERIGRKWTLAIYFLGMAATILLSFGWAFYLPRGLVILIAVLFFLGFFGGNFAVFSLWLPEQYGTEVRVTAFAFTTSIGRFLAAGMNFALSAIVASTGTLGRPVAMTAIAFALGLIAIPFALETRGQSLPE